MCGQFKRLFISYSSNVFISRLNNLTNKPLQLEFSELISLEQFLMSYNDVTHVDDTLFDECTKLQVVKLQNNKLTTVPNVTAAGNSLIQLQLGKPFPVSMVSKVYFMIIYTLKYLCDSRVFHDRRSVRLSDRSLYREEQKRFRQKLPPVGIETRTSGSSGQCLTN